VGPIIGQIFRETLRGLRLVTLDADGTMLDSRDKMIAIHRDLAPRFGLQEPLPYDGTSIPLQLKKLGLSRFARWRYLRECRKRELRCAPKIFSGTNELVRDLKRLGKMVGIVTNRPADRHTFALLRQSGLDLDAFDIIVTYDPDPSRVEWRKRWGLIPNIPKRLVSVEYPKPDKRAFDPVCELMGKLGCSPGEVGHFGDSIPDITAARENHFVTTGVLTGAVRHGSVFYEHGAQFVISCVADARNYL